MNGRREIVRGGKGSGAGLRIFARAAFGSGEESPFSQAFKKET